ncbi:hypothetical protein ACC691_38015, partial [Rhizobium johnstonii]
FFTTDTYLRALWTTFRIWLIVLVSTLVVGYPASLYVGLFVKNKTIQTALLVLCVIPFWTSCLIQRIDRLVDDAETLQDEIDRPLLAQHRPPGENADQERG